MPYDPTRHHRRSIRLEGYDYTQPGAYFITLCTQNREYLFGAVVEGEMRLNEWGEIAREEWFTTARLRPYVRLDEREFVVMPNHVHGIIWIVDDDDAGDNVGGNTMVGAQNTTVGAQNTTVGAQNITVGAQNTTVGAPNTIVGAPNTTVGAPNTIVGA
ncbi:MAG TPA: transposase, partial [Anaerolineae bacterium]|nr:transposase [Anaerolineae bacterium]